MKNMDTNAGKTPIFSMRYNAANEELEELIYTHSDEEPPTPQLDSASSLGDSSPKRDKTSSIIDKYFKSAKADKTDDAKHVEQSVKLADHINASPVKDYLHRFSGKKTGTDMNAVGEPVKDSTNETWKLFHDFKYKIAQAVEDMKSGRAVDSDVKDKPTAREGSVSDSEENSIVCDCDKQSVCDTDNQVSSLESSIQNLSELTAPCSARKASVSEASGLADSHSSHSIDSHTPKNLQTSAQSVKAVDDNQVEVESGVEAFEESGFHAASDELITDSPQLSTTSEAKVTKNTPVQINKSILKVKAAEPTPIILSYTMIILTAIVLMNLRLLPDYYTWNGFLIGIWFFHLATLIKDWAMYKLKFLLLQDYQPYVPVDMDENIPIINIPAIEEHQPLKKFEGWVNQYRVADYDPTTYHINKTNSVFMKLEGTSLRISYTRSKIPKRASWDEQIEKATFFQHRLYNLSGAKINLLPEGLVGRRHWSKKYPLCITLSGKEKVQILEREPAPLKGPEKIPGIPSEPATPEKVKPIQTEPESTESVLSVEDAKTKKKFVWKKGGRRKHSTTSSQSAETDDLISKEGLRHRLIRKLHKEKKRDSDPSEASNTSVIDEVINTIYMEEDQDEQSQSRLSEHQPTAEDSLEDEELLGKIKDMLDFEDWECNLTDSSHSLERWTYKESSSYKNVLFIFARTGRDKLEWHRRLITAISSAKESSPVEVESDKAEGNPVPPPVDEDSTVFRTVDSEASVTLPTNKWSGGGSLPDSPSWTQSGPAGQTGPSSESSPPPEPSPEPHFDMTKHEGEFWPYIYKFMQSSTETLGDPESPLWTDASWLNAFMARAAYDALRNPLWAERARLRIQRKLHTLKLPLFMSPLMVQHIELGVTCPRFAALRGPRADERGLWWYGELRYAGGATLTLTTQVNLIKLKEKGLEQNEPDLKESEPSSPKHSDESFRLMKPAIYVSDVDDTPESSTDEDGLVGMPDEEEEEGSTSETPSASNKKKFLKMVDKITANKYFQQISDYKYVKRAMEGLSNTDIKLSVEMRGLHGELALNLPPPPHDRLWLGFRGNPHLSLKARPAVGARSVRFAHITNWIEQKLCREFQRVLVLPNMEDFLINVMTPTPVSYQ